MLIPPPGGGAAAYRMAASNTVQAKTVSRRRSHDPAVKSVTVTLDDGPQMEVPLSVGRPDPPSDPGSGGVSSRLCGCSPCAYLRTSIVSTSWRLS